MMITPFLSPPSPPEGNGRGSFAYSSGGGGRRFGLSAAHRPGAAMNADLRRNLPGFASARRHPRPEERPLGQSRSRPSRSPARLDPWTLAALLSTLRPLPPAPLFPRALARSEQRPQCAGGRGLRSLPAVFAGARPSLTLTAVDCFPGPLLSGAANLTGDTPRPHRAGERGPVLTVDSIRRFRPRRRPFPRRGVRRSRRGSSSAAYAAGSLRPGFAPPARQPRPSRHCAARLGSGRHPGRFYFLADSPAASARIRSAAPDRASTASFSCSVWWRTRSAS